MPQLLRGAYPARGYSVGSISSSAATKIRPLIAIRVDKDIAKSSAGSLDPKVVQRALFISDKIDPKRFGSLPDGVVLPKAADVTEQFVNKNFYGIHKNEKYFVGGHGFGMWHPNKSGSFHTELPECVDPQLFSTHIKQTLEKPDIVASRGIQIYCRKQIGHLIYEVGCKYQAGRNRAKLNYATALCGYVEKDGQRYYVGLCLKGDKINVDFNAAMIGPRLDGRGRDER